MTPSKSKRPALHQGIIFLTTALVFLAMSVVLLALRDRAMVPFDPSPLTITFEHARPMTVAVAVTRGGTKGIFEVRQTAEAGARILLPSSWTLRELRGGSIDRLRKDHPTPKTTRWSLQPGATASFWIPEQPSHLALRNASASRLEVIVRSIDLEKNTVTEDHVFVTEVLQEIW
ncbi:hypothetical protein HY213_02250 [Candidatus Peregrinibacteria bacterium]|nr:hypothetical protein [Candidatus Peregrinibacteria bacterium]